MAYTFEELKKLKLDELRKVASGIEHEAIKGYSQLNKEHLFKAVCTALSIDTHKHHEVVGIDKSSMKARIRAFKKQRNEILVSKDKSSLKKILRQIRSLKHQIRKATV